MIMLYYDVCLMKDKVTNMYIQILFLFHPLYLIEPVL